MLMLKRWLVRITLLALCFGFGRGVAQEQDDLVQFWKYPKLTAKKPFQRWWWLYQQRAYPAAYVPERAIVLAMEQMREYELSMARTGETIQGEIWQSVGPAPILGGQIGRTSGTRPMSGRVIEIAVDPGNLNRWLIGGAQGGIWETRDAGSTWKPLTDDQAALAVGAITFAPSNPNIIYAGTGTAVFSVTSYAGAGVLKSLDGGASWQLLASSTFTRTSFSEIRVHPTNPNMVLAATTRGVAGRSRQTASPAPSTGLFRSTNGGVSWTEILEGEATDLEVDPTNFNNQYAALGDIFGDESNGVYRSTNAGGTWRLINGPWSNLSEGVGRVEMAIAPSNPNVLYVSIQDAINNVGADGGILGLWRTNNAWAASPTWTQIPLEPTDNGTGDHGYCGWDLAFRSDSDQCWFSHEVAVDPNDPNIFYGGGIPLWKFDGATWTEVSKSASDPRNGIHVDQHALVWAGNRLVVGNDGGVWSTTDGGNTWADHNTNLALTQFYEGSLHPGNSDLLLGGSQDNGTEMWTGSDAWRFLSGGDGVDNAISWRNPDTDWAISSQSLAIRRTTNGGRSFSTADIGIDNNQRPFIARFEQCPSNDNAFIAGTDNLWKSVNFFGPSAPTWARNGPEMGSAITALAFAPSDDSCNTYAFGTLNGQFRLTTDGGNTWVDIDARNAVPNRAVTDLAFDPLTAATLYVTLSGFDESTQGQPGHVFKTMTALASSPTWQNVSPPVNIPSNTVVVSPLDSNVVFVGTDLGVWKSTRAGQGWVHQGPESGMPNVAVFELQMNNLGRLVAFTFGRGAFMTNVQQ